MITRNRAQRKKPPVPKRVSIKSWVEGYISTTSVNRTPEKGLRTTLNQILSQNGTVRPRPSRIKYGPQPIGTVLGEIGKFTKRSDSGVERYLITVQNVDGTAKVYVAKGEDTTWTECDGKEFDTTARCHYCPIRDIDDEFEDEDKVLITNGEDNLAYLDINTLTVVPFTALGTSSINTLTVGSDLTGTTFPNRYRVTASKIGATGETAASDAKTATTTKIRESWSGADEYVDVVIDRVDDADRYHVYYGNTAGSEAYLFSIDDPGTGTTVTWRDTGTVGPDPTRTAPLGDTTAGPICTRASFINGQVFLVGDKNNPKYVRFGGTGTHVLDFSPYGGGGYQPVGGNDEVPVKASSFRDNSGTPAITILCQPSKRYIFAPASQTIGSTVISYFAVREENGNDGTDAPDTVALIRDQLVYMSREGAKTTFTKAQVQTILSTEGLSDKLQPDIARLNSETLSKACAVVDENRWYIALPVGSDSNNEIWSLDFSNMRKGAWMRPWEVPADWMLIYIDNTGNKHFLTLYNDEIFEFTYSVATQDNGVPFSTGASTGMIPFSEDGQEWAKVLRVVFVLQNPIGQIFANVTGRTEDSLLANLGSESFESQNSVVGWDDPLAAWEQFPHTWDDVQSTPQQFGVDQIEIEVEIDEELKWFIAELSSSAAGVDYEWTDLFAEIIPVGTKSNL